MDTLYCAYLRDSGGTEQELSILQQEAAVKAWCTQNSARLTRLFVDSARPGSTIAGRESFEEMIDYLRRGGSGEKGVLIWKFSRFSRDFDDAAFFKADLRRRGFEIISLQDNVPPGDEGRLLEAVIDYMNQRQLRDMSSDIRRGKRFMVTVHKAFPGGKPPAGYILIHAEAGLHRDGRPRKITRLQPDSNTAPLVEKAFKLRAQGATLPEILKQVPGLVDTVPSLGRLLHNKTYIGILPYAGGEVPDYCPPLVDLPTWQAAQQVNRQRRERHGYHHPRTVRSRFVLTGLLKCARCGRPMSGRVAFNHYRSYDYYRCNSGNSGQECGALQIPKAEIESRVIDRLTQELLTPDVLAELYAEMSRQAGQLDAARQHELARLDRNLEDISARLERISAAIEAHGHTDYLLKRLGKLEALQSHLLDRRLEVEASAPLLALPKLTHPDLEALAASAIQRLAGDHTQQAAVLRAFVLEVSAIKEKSALTGALVCHLPPASNTITIRL